MRFQDAISEFPTLKTIYSKLDLQTSMGRQLLLNTEFSSSEAWIRQMWRQTEECKGFLDTLSEAQKHAFECNLHSICDIGGSLRLIEREETLDDVALFEIKTFCLGVKKIRKAFSSELMPLPDLQEVVSILDPEGLEVPQFYIYSAYSEELAAKRQEWEKAKAEKNEEKAHGLYLQTLEIEDTIRQRLCKGLFIYVPKLRQAIRTIAQIDLGYAKSLLAKELNLSMVEICQEPTLSYKAMFHPVIKPIIEERKSVYQDIDIDLSEEVLLITGANMAGKTMILKTLAINQLLLQFGFPIGCAEGRVCLVEQVLCSIGDGQNEEEGLSSFAWEIKNLDGIINRMRQGGRCLVLTDELARTTNPMEGKKLLEGFIKVCASMPSLAVVTTHYSGVEAPCRKMRVKGFISDGLTPPIDINQISRHIDYSLVEDNSAQVPEEALNLCRLLAIDPEWIALSEE